MAQHIRKLVRVVCLILTQPQHYDTKLRAVRNTWLKHCDGVVYMTTQNGANAQLLDNVPQRQFRIVTSYGENFTVLEANSARNSYTLAAVVELPGAEGYLRLWEKTKLSFYYLYKYHMEKFDYFFKCDDDTFAMVDNIKMFLGYRTFPNFLQQHFAQYTVHVS